jgi:hypothetical protein
MDIWEDNVLMGLLIDGHLEVKLDNTTNIKRAKKCMMKYHWLEDILFFQNLVVPMLAKRRMLIEKIHEKIRHFGAMWTLAKVKKMFFWHDKTEAVKKFIRACEKCQLVRQSGNMKSGIEEMKIIPICDFFIVLLWTLLGHCKKKQLVAISMCLLLLIIILNGVKHGLLRNIMLTLLLSF